MASRVTFFVFVTVFLDMIGFGIVIPLLPFYVQSMGGSAEVVGFVLASFSLTQMVATPVLGRLSDRHGRRPVILVSLAGNAVAMLVFAVAVQESLLPLLFISRILAGATAGNLAACQAAIADVTDGPARATGMGRIGAGIGLGLVVGPVLGSAFSHLHWSAPPLAAASLAGTDLVAAYVLMPETRRAAERRAGTPSPASAPALVTVLSDPRILCVMALYFLTFLCMTNIQVSLPLLANARLGWGERDLGQVFGLYGLTALVVQGALIGRLSRHYGALNMLVGGALAVGAAMAAIGEAHHAPALLVGVALAGIGVGTTMPVLASVTSELAGAAQQGAVLGVAQSAGGLARTVGPVWSGMLYQRVGPAAPFLCAALAATVALGVALGLKWRSRGRGLT